VATLLFQFRVELDGDSGKRRTCEVRMVLINAPSASAALTLAKKRGTTSQLQYDNDYGGRVYIEFVGVMDMRNLISCEEDEVWYDIRELLTPMERKSKFIPSDEELIENA
jgi:hypothetical protein